MLRHIKQLVSGECRWIGRSDIHVYCHAPLGHEPAFSVICPDAGRHEHRWTDAETAAAAVQAILAQEPGGTGIATEGISTRNA